MKILYLQLKNFSQIYTAMNGKRKIEIDFTKCKNNIVLFVGKNGSGKTSLLSTLHPFAYPGNMDIRSGSTMIIDNENGYKEIHIDFNGDIYVIKHHYNRNSSGSIIVKSYISKNEYELNPNGNVTSFNEYVYQELSLQSDYLKLLRLGSNVTNIIQMKAAERKNFTSELLSDIGVYTDLFKKISEDSRVLKRLMLAVSSKIERTNVTDKELLQRDINFIEENIRLLTSDKDTIQREKGIIEGTIDTLIPEGLSSFRDKIKSLKTKYEEKKNEIRLYSSNIDKSETVIVGDAETYYNDYNNKYIDLKSKRYSMGPIMESLNNSLNSLYNERDDINQQLSSITSDENYKETENVVLRLRQEIKKLDSKYSNSILNVSRDNIFNLMSVMQEIDKISSDLAGFGIGSMKYCIELIMNNTNVEEFVNKEIKSLDKKIMKTNAEFRNNILPDDCIVLFRPDNCSINDCPYLSLYNKFFNTTSSLEDVSVVSLETQKEFYENVLNVNSNLEYIKRLLNYNDTTIRKLNLKYLSFNYIIKCIFENEPVYDERIFTKIISEIEDYEDYQTKKMHLKDIELSLSNMKGNTTVLNSLKKRYDVINDSIVKLEKDIADNKKETERLEYEISRVESILSLVEDYITNTTNMNTCIDEANTIYDDIHKYEDTLTKVQDNVEQLSYISSRLHDFDMRLKKMQDELFEKNYTMKEYVTLTQERELLSDKYDEIEIIKESVSSTKGIPLLYIQLYFKNIKIFVNKLLESVYDDFTVDDFSITTSEFNIPYTKNGVSVSDVVYASQGETSFLSLALSFALINNSIKDYNILLLDEIDSTLDTKNRSMFLNILNQQIDIIDAEQVFLITHNNMFDSYPVDIILTSDTMLDNYTNANIIFSI